VNQLVSVSNQGNLYRINYRREVEDDYPVFLLKGSSSHKGEKFFIVKDKTQQQEQQKRFAVL
jgi:hypothetical protein